MSNGTKAAEMKRITSERRELEEQLGKVVGLRASLGSEESGIREKLRGLSDRYQALSAQVVVTEKALLRWCQLVLRIDTDAIADEILDEKTRGIIDTIGSGKIPLSNGRTAVVKNKAVVTIE